MARPTSTSPVGFLKPEIPTLVQEPPCGEGWIHEIKHDGYRTLIIIHDGKVRAFSHHGRDWTGPYRRVVEAAGKLSCQAAILDGEIIVQDENGISDFDALRSAIHKARHRIVFFTFDLLHLDGRWRAIPSARNAESGGLNSVPQAELATLVWSGFPTNGPSAWRTSSVWQPLPTEIEFSLPTRKGCK
jgi:hypothetical protein